MRSMWWEITLNCNLRCRHCYLHDTLRGPNEELTDEVTTEQCLNIIDQLDEAHVFTVEVVGGEPFIRKDIMTILNYMGEKKFWTTVDTNGTLVDEKTAKDLADTGINRLCVSLDAPTPESNDFIRGTGSFRKTVRAMNYLREYGIPFRVQMTVNKTNYNEVEKMVRFCSEAGAQDVSIIPHTDCPSSNPFSSSLILDRQEYFSVARKVADLFKEYSKDFISSDFSTALAFLLPPPESTDSRFIRCNLGTAELTILYNGDVVPCPLMRDIVVGNVMKTHLSEIPHLPEFEPIKNLRTLTIDEANEECAACEWRYFCGGGCRGQAYLLQHDLLAPDPRKCMLAHGDPHE
jgi:radical SAM protein with 4Fe4S-binding SPASM domain